MDEIAGASGLLSRAGDAFVAITSWLDHGAAFAVLVCGLLVWAAGGRLVRPAYAALFAAVGGAAALHANQAFEVGFPDIPALVLGGLLGALLGIVLYRVSMAFALGLAFAVLAPIVGAVFLRVDLTAGVPAPAEIDGPLGVAALWTGAIDQAKSVWTSIDGQSQVVLTLLTGVGLLVGLATGLSKPSFVAALATGLSGAAAWMPAAVALGPSVGWDAGAVLGPDATRWIFAWLALGAAGAMLQVMSARKDADKSED